MKVVGRSLAEIRQQFGLPNLTAERARVACHEAGHAVVASAHGLTVTSVWVRDDGNGMTNYEYEHDTPEAVFIDLCAAGIAAIRLCHRSYRHNPFDGSNGDTLELRRLGVPYSDVSNAVNAAELRIRTNLKAFDRIASDLISNDFLTREMVGGLVLPDERSNRLYWTDVQTTIMNALEAPRGQTMDRQQRMLVLA